MASCCVAVSVLPACRCTSVHFRLPLEQGGMCASICRLCAPSILEGVRVLFSHVIPQNYPQPHSHPMWQLAEQVCVKAVSGLLHQMMPILDFNVAI